MEGGIGLKHQHLPSIRFRLGSEELDFSDTDMLLTSPVETPTAVEDKPFHTTQINTQIPTNSYTVNGQEPSKSESELHHRLCPELSNSENISNSSSHSHSYGNSDATERNSTSVEEDVRHPNFKTAASISDTPGNCHEHKRSIFKLRGRRHSDLVTSNNPKTNERVAKHVRIEAGFTKPKSERLNRRQSVPHSFELLPEQCYDDAMFDLDPELRRRHSLFGDMNQSMHGKRNSTEHGIKNHIFSILQASDNKLAMKLFGSKSALLKEKRRQYVSHTWIIHPCSNFRLYWDLLMLIFLVTNLVVLPVAIAFFFNDMGSHWMIFNISCDTLFILDIAVNFRTGIINHESHGEVILDAKTIAIRYIKGWFIVDFFSSLPIDYIFLMFEGHSYTAGRAIRILRLAKLLQLLRLLRISRLVRYVRIWQEYFSLASIVVRIFNLISVMVLLSHWSGCIQFFVPVIQEWPEDSWISIEKLQNAHWWDQYTKSLFKALSHMLCIGYGQYPPSNNTDMWLTIASMLAGATCYALFVGHATTLIQSFDTSSRQFRDHLQQVNEYMSFRKLPPDLRQKITTYYDRKYGGKMFDEQLILAELSDTLRTDIINHNCRELIDTVPFFVQADPNFVIDVITKLKFEMYMPGDTVIRINARGDRMFFIQEGIVEVLNENENVITRLANGSYFGEISLLSNKLRVATVRAASYCNLFSLSKENFDHILASYPVMKRTLETIAAQRLSHLGIDPSLVTSRESLLDDVNGIQKMMVNEIHSSDDEDVQRKGEEQVLKRGGDSQIFSAFKSFFTTDSENFANIRQQITRSNSRAALKRMKSSKGVEPKSKSTLYHLFVPGTEQNRAPKRTRSSVELSATVEHESEMERGRLQSLERLSKYRASSQHLNQPASHEHKSQANNIWNDTTPKVKVTSPKQDSLMPDRRSMTQSGVLSHPMASTTDIPLLSNNGGHSNGPYKGEIPIIRLIQAKSAEDLDK